MTRREQLEQAAIEINMDLQTYPRLLDRLVAVGEWADKNPSPPCFDPITSFKIHVTYRIDLPTGPSWHVHVADQEGIWSFDGSGEFSDVLGFIEMGMQAVNNSIEKSKKECSEKGHDIGDYGNIGLKYCHRCGKPGPLA